jgi:hypothetical protein
LSPSFTTRTHATAYIALGESVALPHVPLTRFVLIADESGTITRDVPFTVFATRTAKSGAPHAEYDCHEQLSLHARERNVPVVGQPADVQSVEPDGHESTGSPVQAVTLHEQYFEHVFVCVPQFPQLSFATSPGVQPPAISSWQAL